MTDQERADQLAQALDKLLAGQAPELDDPLLNIARSLVTAPVQPSAQAVARFEQQLAGWFGRPTPTPRPNRIPWLLGTAILVVIAVIIVIVIITRPPVISPPTFTPTHTATVTTTGTGTSTGTSTTIPTITPTTTPTILVSATVSLTDTPTPDPTAMITATITATLSPGATASPTVSVITQPTVSPVTSTLLPPPTQPPGTATPIPFVRVVIDGPIESITDNLIIVLSQTILIDDGSVGLCQGDLIRIEAVFGADGKLHVQRGSVRVTTSACNVPAPQIAASPKPGGGDKGDKGDSDDDEHHHKDK